MIRVTDRIVADDRRDNSRDVLVEGAA